MVGRRLSKFMAVGTRPRVAALCFWPNWTVRLQYWPHLSLVVGSINRPFFCSHVINTGRKLLSNMYLLKRLFRSINFMSAFSLPVFIVWHTDRASACPAIASIAWRSTATMNMSLIQLISVSIRRVDVSVAAVYYSGFRTLRRCRYGDLRVHNQ